MILYVEDNEWAVRAVREALKAKSWYVEVCENGARALSKIEGRDDYELFLLDQDLPGATGLQLLRRVRELPHRRSIPVIIFTSDECEKEAVAAGADALLRKPTDINKLSGTIVSL